MTEKDYNPEQKNSKAMKKQEVASKKQVETPKEIVKDIEKSGVPKKTAEKEEKLDEKKQLEKKETKTEEKVKAKPRIKKEEAKVNEKSIPISTKHSIAICRFIKGKSIEKAIVDLEQVILKKKPVPMKGEIPHKKGIMSGRFPEKASMQFVKILKRLSANSNVNGINNPVIVSAVSNFAQRPYGRFGSTQKKRTHIQIIAKQMKEKKK